jgi:four helix bundle protein
MSKVESRPAMSRAERFEDLRVWQEARALVRAINHDTRELRDFGFRDQIRAAALSAMNNIAEGFERRTDADFAHFLDIAKGSSGEVRSMTYVGEDEAYFPAPRALELRGMCERLSSGLAAFAI